MIAPIFDDLSTEFPEITFAKVDVDDMEKTAADAGIKSMPTFQVHIDGTPKKDWTVNFSSFIAAVFF